MNFIISNETIKEIGTMVLRSKKYEKNWIIPSTIYWCHETSAYVYFCPHSVEKNIALIRPIVRQNTIYMARTIKMTLLSLLSSFDVFSLLFYEFNIIFVSFPVYATKPTIHSVFLRFAPFSKKLFISNPYVCPLIFK